MLNHKSAAVAGLALVIVLCLGCEPVAPGPQTGLIDGQAVNQALAAENVRLQKQQEQGDKEKLALAEKLKAYQGKEQAWIIAQNEIDIIIEDLARYGGQSRRDRIALDDQFFFKAGSADLTDQGMTYLQKIALELKRIDYLVHVEGHTDSTPVQNPATKRLHSDNWGLSADRAASVVRYLQSQGIPGERLVGVFYSQYRPVADESDKEGKRLNRRVEIRLVPPFEMRETASVGLIDKPDQKLPDAGFRSTDSFLGGSQTRQPVVKKEEVPVVRQPEGIIPIREDETIKVEQPKVIKEVEDGDTGEEAPVIIK